MEPAPLLGWIGGRRWGLPSAPVSLINPSLTWARTRQAAGLLAGRQALPNSQLLPRSSRVPWEWLHPLAPLHTGSPRQQVLTAPLPFHLVIMEQAKGPGRADPGPDAWRSIQFPGHSPLVAMKRLQMECSLEGPQFPILVTFPGQ